MKPTTWKRAFAAAALLALTSGCWAQISVTPGGSLKIEGDSTLHKWSSTATGVAMTFDLADGAPRSLAEAIKASKIKGLEVRIAVAGLKSGESGLDKNMRQAMDAEKNPDVVYRLERYELAKGTTDGVMTAKASGELTIAGTTKPVTMDVEFRLGPDAADLKGSYTLEMSDYGIKPPTLMLGTIKVRDPVTIRFDLILKPEDAAKKTGA
ncbi:MAG TPA: YceI family protein [Elusimicrobiota bacterium]|jgi:polyisoprenoid-binding protein YceI|nr:YceI family protein [Elusimicrobiota bacterium]